MLFNAITALLAVIPASGVLGGQIPVVNGVLGGTSHNTNAAVKDLKEDLKVKTTPGKLRVTENSGVCETTKGVYQASGYGDLTSNESIWYGIFDYFTTRSQADINIGSGSSKLVRTQTPPRSHYGSMEGTCDK